MDLTAHVFVSGAAFSSERIIKNHFVQYFPQIYFRFQPLNILSYIYSTYIGLYQYRYTPHNLTVQVESYL